MIEGRIMKGIGGFYYVNTSIGLIECKPRGLFRKNKKTPIVGDLVLVSLIGDSTSQGIIYEILPRHSLLLRPSVANVQQCVVVIAVKKPKPDLLLADRLLILAHINNIKGIICLNKMDLSEEGGVKNITDAYRRAGYKVLCTSTKTGRGIEDLKEALREKISVFAGMSGVGKSSIINTLQPGLDLRVGEISDRLKRGRHITRHTKLLDLDFGGMVVDTPGFSSLDLSTQKALGDIEEKEFGSLYKEFVTLAGECKYVGCTHINEPGCAIKNAVQEGKIALFRYNNYIVLLEELRRGRRRKYD